MIPRALAAMRRRWYVALLMVAAFVGIGVGLVGQGGTYYSKTVVWFTIDSAPTILPGSGVDTPDVIAFAGAIATAINLGRPPTTYSSPDAPYFGAGVREGVLVSLRDVGGQWSTWFQAAVIELQVVGRTSEWVEARRDALLDRIGDDTERLGRASDPSGGVTVTVEPLTSGVEYIGASMLSRALSFTALAIGGVLVTGLTCMRIDAMAARPRRTRSPHGETTNENREVTLS